MVFDVQLVLLNITTIEQVRTAAAQSSVPGETRGPEEYYTNPFTLGWRKNVAYMLCRPAGYSWIEADQPAMEDRRLVNPGVRLPATGWKAELEHHHGIGDGHFGEGSRDD